MNDHPLIINGKIYISTTMKIHTGRRTFFLRIFGSTSNIKRFSETYSNYNRSRPSSVTRYANELSNIYLLKRGCDIRKLIGLKRWRVCVGLILIYQIQMNHFSLVSHNLFQTKTPWNVLQRSGTQQHQNNGFSLWNRPILLGKSLFSWCGFKNNFVDHKPLIIRTIL